MSNLWMEIESLVLDGVPMDSIQGRRLAQLTEVALARLLEQRGASTQVAAIGEERDGKKETGPPGATPANMRLPAHANEARWAEEIALAVYRSMDGTL
jgi:hypothetical protein